MKDMVGEAERLEIKESKAVMVLVELLLDANAVKQIPQVAKSFSLYSVH